MTKDSLLQSNVDFDYLGDDDDDDDTGGAGGNVFDATINASLVSSAAVGDNISFQVDATAGGGAQTSGAIKVTITEASGAVASTPSTTALAGWSESGWSYASGVWTNTLTKASVAVGTTSPTFQFTATSGTGGGFIVATSTAPSPRTAEATGAGNSRIVTISAASFDALVSGPGSVSAAVAIAVGFSVTAAATASGTAQTNGTFDVWIVEDVVSGGGGAITTTALDGWSETGWSSVPNVSGIGVFWRNTFSRTTVPIGTTNVTFTIRLPSDWSGDVSFGTNYDAAYSTTYPTTSEDTGTGNAYRTDIT